MTNLEFEEKSLPALHVAQRTATVSGPGDVPRVIGPMFDQLVDELGPAGALLPEPAVAWYLDGDDGLHLGAAFPIDAATTELRDLGGVEVADLAPVERAVTAIHRGHPQTIGASWQELAQECAARGHELVGPCREVYLEAPLDDQDAWVTELQQPVG